MNGLIADANFIGQLGRLLTILRSPEWNEFWDYVRLPVFGFDALGLTHEANDRVVWQACQAAGYLLITANRNHEGANSLDAAIRDGPPTALPVFTVGDGNRVRNDGSYARIVAVHLLEYLTELRDRPGSLLGTGRLFLPKKPV